MQSLCIEHPTTISCKPFIQVRCIRRKMLCATDTRGWLQIKNVFILHGVQLVLPDGSVYTQTVPIHQVSSALEMNVDPLPGRYRRLVITNDWVTAGPLLAKADGQHESYHLISQMTDQNFFSGEQNVVVLLLCSYSKRTRRWPIH